MASKPRTARPRNLPGFGKLGAYLRRRGLSQEAFANQAGLDRIVVLRLVNGDRSWVSCDCAAAIEVATEGEITVLDFMGEPMRRRLGALRRKAA